METNEEQIKFEMYKLLIQARNFHFDNFNKWMTYYYVAIGSLSIALFNANTTQYKFVILLLGFSISILWYLSSKGYYYWINHWIKLIMKFEKENFKEEKEKIYSIFSKEVYEEKTNYFSITGSSNISTSKTTLIFAMIVAVTWGYLLIDFIKSFLNYEYLPKIFCVGGELLVSYLFIVFIYFIASNFIKSQLDNHFKV